MQWKQPSKIIVSLCLLSMTHRFIKKFHFFRAQRMNNISPSQDLCALIGGGHQSALPAGGAKTADPLDRTGSGDL